MISAGDFKNGVTVEIEGNIYSNFTFMTILCKLLQIRTNKQPGSLTKKKGL